MIREEPRVTVKTLDEWGDEVTIEVSLARLWAGNAHEAEWAAKDGVARLLKKKVLARPATEVKVHGVFIKTETYIAQSKHVFHE